jgi:hypothetical protein
MKRLGGLVVVVLLLTACGSSGKETDHATVATATSSPVIDYPTPAPVDPETSPVRDDGTLPPPAAKAGSAQLISAGPSLNAELTIGTPLGVSAQEGGNLWLGIPVTVSGAGAATFSAANLGVGPVDDSENGNVATGDDQGLVGSAGEALDRTACNGLPLLGSVDVVGGKRRGCVVFGYSAGDRLSTVSYNPDGATGDDSLDATWAIAVATVKPAAPETGIVYSVTSQGGIQSVTFATANFNQQQDTEVSGTSWTVKIPDAGVSVASVLAQNGGSGPITCSITEDGQQLTSQTSNGLYAVVTCTAAIG